MGFKIKNVSEVSKYSKNDRKENDELFEKQFSQRETNYKVNVIKEKEKILIPNKRKIKENVNIKKNTFWERLKKSLKKSGEE